MKIVKKSVHQNIKLTFSNGFFCPTQSPKQRYLVDYRIRQRKSIQLRSWMRERLAFLLGKIVGDINFLWIDQLSKHFPSNVLFCPSNSPKCWDQTEKKKHHIHRDQQAFLSILIVVWYKMIWWVKEIAILHIGIRVNALKYTHIPPSCLFIRA